MTRWMRVLLLRFRSLFIRSTVDRDLDRELRFHLEEQVEELVAAGASRQDAREAALREFGSPASITQQCRETRRVNSLQNLLQDTRYALRTLAKQPMLLVTAASSIALGAGANLAIFGLANSLLLSTPTAARPDRLVHLRTNSGSHTSYSAWRELDASGVMAGIAGYDIESDMNWRGRDVSIGVMPLVVTANFFDVMGIPLAMGRAFTAAEASADRDPRVAVLSHRFWTARLGGDPSVLGSSVILNGHAYVVLGVLPSDLRSLPGYGLSPEMFIPISPALAPNLHAPRAGHLQLIGRLRDGQTAEGAWAALNVAASHWAGEDPLHTGFIRVVDPVGGLYQVKELKEVGAFFAVLLLVTALVLAIACANVAGLLVARSAARQKEIALRMALGATRTRIVQQLLTEGSVLAVAGTIAGVAITAGVARLISRVALPLPVPFDLNVTFDTRLAVLSVALVLVSTLLCALAPALQATRGVLSPGLKQETRTFGPRRFGMRGVLVTGQVAVSVLLLVTTVLFLRNLGLANSLDPGFDAAHTVVAQISFVEGRQGEASNQAVEGIVERLRGLASVEAATFTQGVPLTFRYGGSTGTMMRIEGRAAPVRVEYATNSVGSDYFRVMGIRLLRGREFTNADRGDGRRVIVNEEFVRRYFEGLEPIGRTVFLHGDPEAIPAEVVGVVANSKYRSIGEDREAALYTPFLTPRPPARFAHVLVRTSGPPESVTTSVKDAVLRTDPAAAVSVEPMTTALAFAFWPSRIGAVLVGSLGALGALLAMIGLYGVVSFAVARRTAEIGVRLALGATRRAIALLVFRDGATLVFTGMVIGLGLALLATRPLAWFLVADLPPTDPISFVGTILLLGLTSLAAGWSPTRRAMKIEPAKTLRTE
ncbi:MAG TPA: ABC transporter permease [Vicinamibacterales bacterium]|nr:ABC transporter permease [Vicinamibacterales bacterium]